MAIIYEKLEQMYHLESGVGLIAAPTGSGKTHSVKELTFNKITEKKEILEPKKKAKKELEQEESEQLSLFDSLPESESIDKDYTKLNYPAIVYLVDKKNSVSEVYNETVERIKKTDPKDERKILICKPKEELTEMLLDVFFDKKKKIPLLNTLLESVKSEIKDLESSFRKYEKSDNHEKDVQEKRRENFDKAFNVLSKSIAEWIKERVGKGKVSDEELVYFVNSHKDFEWCRALYPLSFIKEYEMIVMTYSMFSKKARGLSNGDVWVDFFLKADSNQNSKNDNGNDNDKTTKQKNFCFIFDEVEAFKKVIREEFVERAVDSSINSLNAIGTIYSVVDIKIPVSIDGKNPHYKESVEQLKSIIDNYFKNWDFRNKLIRASEEISKEFLEDNNLLTFYNDGIRQISSGLKRHELFFVNLEDAIYLCHKNELSSYLQNHLQNPLQNPQINYISTQELITNIERVINFFCKSTVPEGARATLTRKKDPRDISKEDKEIYCNTFKANGENNELKNYILSTLDKPKNMQTTGWGTTFNKNFYSSGFEYLLINQNQGGNIEMQRFDMQVTPEEILVQLANNYPVVLMSATSPLQHHDNINLEYVKNNVSIFLDWTKEDTDKIETELNYKKQVENIDVAFNKTVANYEFCQKAKDKKNFISNHCKLFFREEEKKEFRLAEEKLDILAEKISSYLLGNDNHITAKEEREQCSLIVNYLDFLKHYYFFKKENIKSGVLFFNPKLSDEICGHLTKILDETFGFKESSITTVFAYDLNENDKKSEADESTNTNIDKFKEDYAKGIDCFVVTTYASLAKGVNFTFDIQENESIIHIAQKGRSHSTDRSFQAVAFGNITHLFSNSGKEIYETYRSRIINTFNKLYDFNEMYMRGAISPKELDDLINCCFKKNNELTIQKMTENHNNGKFNQEVYNNKAMNATHYLYQACGRLFRTTALSTKMAISITSANYNFFKSAVDFKESQNMPKNVIMNHLTKIALSEKNEIKELQNTIKDLQSSTNSTSFENNSSKNIFKNRMAKEATKFEVIIKMLLSTIVHGEDKRNEMYLYDSIRNLIFENGLLINEKTFNELTNKEDVGSLFESIYIKIEPEVELQSYYFTEKTRLYDVSLSPKSHYTEVDLNNRFEKQFLKFNSFKEYLKDKNINFFNQDLKGAYYILNPYAYMSIFKGILGEEFFKHLCEIEDLPFQTIKDPILYERADFISQDSTAAVDVKSYKNDDTNLDNVVDKIIEYKADVLNVTKYYVVNVHPGQNEHYHPTIKTVKTKGGRNVEVVILQLVKKEENGNGNYQYFYIDENIQELKKGFKND